MTMQDRPAGQARATVLAFHGFTRSPRHLQALAMGCVASRLAVVRPSVAAFWWPRSANNSSFLSSLARDLERTVTGPVVIAGHSAGASAGSWVGARLIESGADVRGVVYLDGVDGPGHFIERSWPVISRVPVRAVLAPPCPCNRNGKLERWLGHAVGDVSVTVVADAGHGDIEDGDPLAYRIACGRRSTADAHARFLAAALTAIDDVLESAA